MNKSYRFSMPALVLSFACALPLLAQDPPPATSTAAPSASSDDQQETPLLEEIVVTAQKREESVQDVPVAVTAVPDEALEVVTAGGADVKALSGRVPSLLIESSFGRAFPRFYIRGLGNTDFDLNASQPVSMVYDEVVLENPVLKGLPMFDLDRVEVLRGPQGTLFGRNTPAGIVKFESKKPTRDFEAYARASYATFDTVDVKGALGGALGATLSGRLSFLYQSQSDWVQNRFAGVNNYGDIGGYDNFAYRGQLLWEPTKGFNALLNLHGWDIDGTARIFRANILKKGTNELVDDFDQRIVFEDGKNAQTINGTGAVLRMNYDVAGGTLTSVTGYETLEMFSRGDIDGGYGAVFAPPSGPGVIAFPSESSDGIPDLDQFTQEVRFATNSNGPLRWLVGAFYFDEGLNAETRSFTSLAPGNPQEGLATQTQDTTSWALFTSIDYAFSPRWKMKGGLRYSHDEKDFAAERTQPLFFNVATIRPITTSTDNNNVSWDLSSTFAMSSAVNLYGRLATGYRAPSIQGRILFAPDTQGGTNPATNGLSVADEEKITSGEVGIKSELLDRRLRLNATVFKYVVDGQQVTAVGGQYNVSTILNADKTNGYGFETDINFAPAPQWMLTLGTSYNHTEIDDPNLTVAPCGGGCTVLDPVSNGVAFVNGNSLPHAPEWIVNGILDYRNVVGSGAIIGSLDLAYSSEKQFFLYESKEFHSDSFELGLRLGYALEKWELAVFGRNITDEVIVQNGIDFNNLTGMTNEPRMWGVEVVRRF